jgi:hypothetical protein
MGIKKFIGFIESKNMHSKDKNEISQLKLVIKESKRLEKKDFAFDISPITSKELRNYSTIFCKYPIVIYLLIANN